MDTDVSPRATSHTSITPLTVLVADDDPWIREVICYVLQDAGHTVLEATGGDETLDLHRAHPHLVVVLDLLMRHGTGFDVLAAVARDDALAHNHAFVVCTAHKLRSEDVGPHFAALLQRLGIPFVAKPFDIDELLAAVAAVAERLATRISPWTASDTA